MEYFAQAYIDPDQVEVLVKMNDSIKNLPGKYPDDEID